MTTYLAQLRAAMRNDPQTRAAGARIAELALSQSDAAAVQQPPAMEQRPGRPAETPPTPQPRGRSRRPAAVAAGAEQ